MEYKITLTEQELSILSAALVELPFKIAAPLVERINRQIAEQRKKEEPASVGAGKTPA